MRLSRVLLVWALLPAWCLASDEPQVVPLWPSGAPGSEGKTDPEVVTERGKDGVHDRHISRVHSPTLTVYLPPRDKANGTAVVICPGGGHRILAIDHEGHDVARRLNEMGVAAFVLKYRLARTEGPATRSTSTRWPTPGGRSGWSAATPRSGGSIPSGSA